MAPATPRQERLHAVTMEDVRSLSELSDRRGNAVQTVPTALFPWPALVGVVLVSAASFTWPATALNLGLIAGFSGYAGLILSMTVAFSKPFAAPGHAAPTAFERFLTAEPRALAET